MNLDLHTTWSFRDEVYGQVALLLLIHLRTSIYVNAFTGMHSRATLKSWVQQSSLKADLAGATTVTPPTLSNWETELNLPDCINLRNNACRHTCGL